MDKYIGIDLGGSKLRINDIDAKGKTSKEHQVIIAPSVINSALADISVRSVENIIKRVHKEGHNVAGIGYGSPGPLDYKRGVIETPPNLPNIKNLPIIKILGEHFPEYPAFLVHDADAALLAEQWLGAAKNFDNVAMVTAGTGLGFAVTNDRRLVRGKGRAAEAGHADIDVEARRLCSCGRYNHWEAFVSTDGLARTYCDVFGEKFEDLNQEERYNVSFEMRKWQSSREGKPGWLSVFDRYSTHVVLGLRNVLCNFNPECIVLGGGIMSGNEELVSDIRKFMSPGLMGKMAPLAVGVEIRLASLPNAGVVGAAKYAMDSLKE